MSKTFAQLVEQVNPCPVSTGPVTAQEAGKTIQKFKKVFGVVHMDFDFSEHALVDRLNHERNRPPISTCEFDFVLSNFIKKQSKQLMDDEWDVSKRKVVARGKRKENIRPNNYEYGITSKSTGVAIVLAVQPNPKRGTHQARVNIVTVIRKKGFGVNQGEHIMVEAAAAEDGHTIEAIEWVQVD